MIAWIGVDFDGTLAEYTTYKGVGVYGRPISAMVDRVKGWNAEGKLVKIFTARASDPNEVAAIFDWCNEHIGHALEVTNVKDYGMVALYDDRCVQVEPNLGVLMVEAKDRQIHVLTALCDQASATRDAAQAEATRLTLALRTVTAPPDVDDLRSRVLALRAQVEGLAARLHVGEER